MWISGKSEIKPNAFANRLIIMSWAKIDKETSRKLSVGLKIKKMKAIENSRWTNKFIFEEVKLALKHVKLKK